ncbi:minor capsid protein [Petroclostridium sp. X23]|uniref:minor capsid protein n=1 Tax=Petroclostridium sp. X23 TaxID=3045146 RepID=UPI0024ADDC55|nr:minor capsid protein [Petroclostridium sp. X23]WHH58483.1 minor capsid protein [Petroclostridium sp. X23]
MAIRVKVKMNRAKMKELSAAQRQALEMTADAVKTDVMTSAVVPKQTGELERSAFVDDTKLKRGRVKLVYDTPYARRLYWHPEYNFRTDKNRKAGGKWLEPWISGDKKNFAKNSFKRLYRRLTRGVVQ